MKITRLRDKLLLSAVAICFVLALAYMLAVSLVIRQQYLNQSNALLRKASHIIENSLTERANNLLSTSRQLATQKNLGSTIWYLTQYAQSDIDRETLFNTYRQLAKETYEINYGAKHASTTLYGATGDLISFALLDGKRNLAGYVERAPTRMFQVATLQHGAELSQQNLSATNAIPGLSYSYPGPLPRQESVRYAIVGGTLSIESTVPVMGEAFDPATGKAEIRQLGLVVMVQPLDQSFVDHLAGLTDTQINIFTPQGLSSGSMASYRALTMDRGTEARPAAGTIDEIQVGGESFYQSLIPLQADNKVIGTIAVLHSKEVVRKNTWEMIRILGLIAIFTLLFIFPLAWYFATSISRPLTALSQIFRGVASGKYSGTLSNELRHLEKEKARSDELGDLTQSFIAMDDAVNQKIQQINEINASLEGKIAQRTADLRIAATAFESQESLMITDAAGVILRVNRAFIDDSGYSAEEIIGQTPHMFKSGRQSAEFYHEMWDTIRRTGSWQGEIWDRRKNGDVYPKWLTISAVKNDEGIITHYVGSHIDITERKAVEEEIQQLAFYDPLTRLPNRRLLLDRLKQALASSARSGRAGALLFIDLDNFKNLNDTLGHDTGDLLLQRVTERLTACIREGDTVARLGGDEFVVMLLDLSGQPIEAAGQVEAIGEKILDALSQPYQLRIHAHRCTGSIGVTLFHDTQQATEELMKQADIAMYQAKKAGRNTLRFFDQQMQESISARVSLEGELHKAIEEQQFRLFYQIQVDRANRALGAEALIRWMHPERALVSPVQFIPLAEETGLILPIGQWVLEAACARLNAWQQDARTRDLTLAVNVSARQFRQDDFVTQVRAAVQRQSIDPNRLKLELTESMLLDDIENTISTINALREIGVQFSLDDFGTGYSSLQYLKRLQLDQIKIDQSFVCDLATDNSDQTIVRTIIAMAHSLDMDIIAEGVETEAQRQVLSENGCASYQGYLFGKPLPVEQFEALLKQA